MLRSEKILSLLTIITNLWVPAAQALELNNLDKPVQIAVPGIDLEGGSLPCPGFKNFVAVRIENEAGKLPVRCEDIHFLDGIYSQVAEISPTPLLMPALSMQNSILPAIEQYNVVWLRFDLGVEMEKPAQLMALSPQFVHEIGHHIFYSLAFQQAEKLGYYQEAGQIILLYNSSMIRARAEVDSAEIFKHQSYQSFALMLEILSQHFGTRETLVYDVVSNAYQELFADVLAAVVYEDPEVMVNSISQFEIQVDPEVHNKYVSYRSFSENQPVTLESTQYYHYHFASLRSDLWKQWVVPRLGDKKALLSELLNIFLEEIKRRVDSGEETPSKPLTDDEKIAANKKNAEALRAKLNLK